MSANIHRHVHVVAQPAVPADRRDEADRRLGIDRRGTEPPSPPQGEPRPYGFREFGERRDYQDRRLYGLETVGFSPAEPEAGEVPGVEPGAEMVTTVEDEASPFGIVPLSEGELRALLRRSEH
jgi:hypothetical protein